MSDVDGLINAANVHETRIFLLFDDFEILYALSAVKCVPLPPQWVEPQPWTPNPNPWLLCVR